MGEAGFLGVVLFFGGTASLQAHPLHNGHTYGHLDLMCNLYTAAVVAVTLRICYLTQHWTWINHLFYWGSIGLWFLWLLVQGAVPTGILTKGYLYKLINQEGQLA